MKSFDKEKSSEWTALIPSSDYLNFVIFVLVKEEKGIFAFCGHFCFHFFCYWYAQKGTHGLDIECLQFHTVTGIFQEKSREIKIVCSQCRGFSALLFCLLSNEKQLLFLGVPFTMWNCGISARICSVSKPCKLNSEELILAFPAQEFEN